MNRPTKIAAILIIAVALIIGTVGGLLNANNRVDDNAPWPQVCQEWRPANDPAAPATFICLPATITPPADANGGV